MIPESTSMDRWSIALIVPDSPFKSRVSPSMRMDVSVLPSASVTCFVDAGDYDCVSSSVKFFHARVTLQSVLPVIAELRCPRGGGAYSTHGVGGGTGGVADRFCRTTGAEPSGARGRDGDATPNARARTLDGSACWRGRCQGSVRRSQLAKRPDGPENRSGRRVALCRQREPEPRALPGRAFHADGPTVQLDELLGDGQAQPAPATSAGPGLFSSPEAFKDVG